MDEVVSEEVAETVQTEAPAETEQQETAETVTTEATTEQAATEAVATEPERITKAEAEAMASQAAAKAVAELQRRYDQKLQDNAHAVKTAQILERLNDRLDGKTPVDPNAPPEGFEALPEAVQKMILNLNKTTQEVQKTQAQLQYESFKNRVDEIAYEFKSDPKTGATFTAVESKIGEEIWGNPAMGIPGNPHLQNWLRTDPRGCIEKLYKSHAADYQAQATTKAATEKVTAALRASTRPSSTTTGSPSIRTQVAAGQTNYDPFEEALKLHGVGKNDLEAMIENM